MVPALKPIPRRYKNGQRVRKSRSYAAGATNASLYVVECPSAKVVKIGYSASPSHRMESLRKESGQPLFLRWSGETTRGNARAIEKAFHAANKGGDVHAVGEWYKRSGEAVIVEIISIAERLGISLTHRGNVRTLNGASAHEAEASAIGRVLPWHPHDPLYVPFETR